MVDVISAIKSPLLCVETGRFRSAVLKRFRAKRQQLETFKKTFTRKPRPESGLDCHISVMSEKRVTPMRQKSNWGPAIVDLFELGSL